MGGFSQAHEDSAAALAEAHRKLTRSAHGMQAAVDALSAHATPVIGRGLLHHQQPIISVDWGQSGALGD